MLYNDAERALMANALHANMRLSSPAVQNSIISIKEGYLGNRDLRGSKLLDIGPGQCDFLDIAREQGAITYGVDYDRVVVKLGEMRGHRMSLHNLSKGWPSFDTTFDGIFCRASINAFWFVDGSDQTRLRTFLDQLIAALAPSGWMWVLPWNNIADNQKPFVEPTRKTISDWAKANRISIDVVGAAEKKRYQLSYSLPYIETWTRNCRTHAEQDPLRQRRWALGGVSSAARGANLFAAYEACRKRLLAGANPGEERHALHSVLEFPETFWAEIAKIPEWSADRTSAVYAAFIASRPKSDVLFSYLSVRLGTMTQGRLDKEPGTKGRVYGWGWVYWGRAAVYAYQATLERRYIDILLDGYERLLNERDDSLAMSDDVRGRIVKSWGVQTPESPLRTSEVTATGLQLLPICELLLSPAAKDLTEECRNRLVTTITESLDEFVNELTSDAASCGGYYVSPFDRSVEALNHSHLLGAAFAKASQITGRDKYRHIADLLSRYFLESCVLEGNDTYSWAYAPTPGKMRDKHPLMSMEQKNINNAVGGEAFYKAAVTIELPLAARQAGICLSANDMNRIANSFLQNVVQPNDDLNLYISSRKIRPAAEFATKYSAQYMLICGFALLDEVNEEVRRALVRLFSVRSDWFPNGWFGGPAGIMALAHFMSRTSSRLNE